MPDERSISQQCHSCDIVHLNLVFTCVSLENVFSHEQLFTGIVEKKLKRVRKIPEHIIAQPIFPERIPAIGGRAFPLLVLAALQRASCLSQKGCKPPSARRLQNGPHGRTSLPRESSLDSPNKGVEHQKENTDTKLFLFCRKQALIRPVLVDSLRHFSSSNVGNLNFICSADGTSLQKHLC